VIRADLAANVERPQEDRPTQSRDHVELLPGAGRRAATTPDVAPKTNRVRSSAMAYIPRDAKWYIAEIVERLQVQGDPRAAVHVNLCLIEATGPAIAYRRALALGKAAEITYLNPKGRKVSIEFLGLRDLNVVHDRLEHGAELLYRQYVGLAAAAARKLVTRRTKLSVFRPLERPSGPDYSSAEIVEGSLKLVHLAKARRRPNRRKAPRDGVGRRN
jgi:hypothetical protein